MNNLKRLAGILLFSLSVFSGMSQRPRVELSGTEVITFTSSIDSQQYILHVNLPDNYARTDRKYPVLYVTDGQWFFPSMYAAYGGLHYDGFVPDLITVGITWPENYNASRQRDFTPRPVIGIPNSGNAGRFLFVIKDEIFKLIASAYRVDEKDRALFGSSLGGVFAIYTLFHDPSLFSRYIIISPALEWDNGILFQYEKSFAEKNHDLNAKVFISSGEYEEAIVFKSLFKKFVDQLESRHYPGLQLKSAIIEGMSHSSSATAGGMMGFQYIYSKPTLQLGNARLDEYSGHYVSGKDSLLLARSGSFLYFRGKTGDTKIFAETPAIFYIKGFSGSIRFSRDDKNEVSGFNLIKDDTTIYFKRLN